jgi:hypothetical protein
MNLKYYPVNIRHYIKYKLGVSPAYSQTSESERLCLTKWAKGKKRIAEIGVFEGVNTRNFRSVMDESGTIIAIDPYFRSFFGLLGFGWIRRIAHNEVRKADRGSVIWVEDLGANAWRNTKVNPYLPLDFLFIDGDHSYDGVKGDWDAWSPHVGLGGVVALHDSINCSSPNVGSEIFTQEVIKNDQRFEFVEEVDTLSIFIRQ